MLKHKETLVIKVGTSTLTTQDRDGYPELDQESFNRIGDQIGKLSTKMNIVLVSSAAITAGMEEHQMKIRPSAQTEIAKLQALAAIGQPILVDTWRRSMKPKPVGQILVTANTFKRPDETTTFLNNLDSLHDFGAIPIINENDAVSTSEIALGDNDTLAARIAGIINKSKKSKTRLVLLTDVDAVYEKAHDPSTRIKLVDNIERHISFAKDTYNPNGTGGMITKFEAAKIANESGVEMWITNGRTDNAILQTLNGAIGTYFLA